MRTPADYLAFWLLISRSWERYFAMKDGKPTRSQLEYYGDARAQAEYFDLFGDEPASPRVMELIAKYEDPA